ncbi:MAG TPA: hypothetical protein VMV47_17595 [Bacteroidales bacterium]|nr:hypothetical protein [Bacteroidales bacterium]
MDNIRTDGMLKKTAKAISVVFHPLFMPLYGLVLIFYTPTLFGYLPFNVKRILFLIVLVNNILLPLSLLPYLRYRNQITSWAMENRRERILPLFIATILYAATSYIIIRYPVPVFIKTFVMGIFIISLLITAVTLWWKISIHATAVGAVSALVLVLSVKMNSALLWPLLFIIFVSGLTLSARLKLNAHNPSEVWAGFFFGYASMGLIMFLV